MTEEFDAAIQEAKRLEAKCLAYAPYEGAVSIEKTLDLEPKEYMDYTYQDMLNLYERNKKILSTAVMGILTTDEVPATKPEVTNTEVESRIKEMTTETLQKAEEVAKEPVVIETVVEHVEPKQEKIEFETKTVVEKEIQLEAPKETERKVIVANVPPALKEAPEESVEKYARMEEQVRAAVGQNPDELTLKKKMLDLTKQLFKEKTTSRREELKLQITVLKNMLTGTQSKTKTKKKEDAAHTGLFETMITAHQAEIAETKDSIISSYKKQISDIQKKFYADLSNAEDQAKKKQILEALAFSVTSLAEQLPEVIEKYRDFASKKHAAELEKFRGSLNENEDNTRSMVDKRLDYVQNSYGQEFTAVKGIIGKEIENLIDAAGVEVFKKPEEKQKESEAKIQEVIKEINETDDGTLLYYLHSKEQEYYKKYEHKQISKSEAIFKAKELMAIEKGLSDSAVRKYFSQKED